MMCSRIVVYLYGSVSLYKYLVNERSACIMHADCFAGGEKYVKRNFTVNKPGAVKGFM